MKVYISGAISGLAQAEYSDLFGRAEAALLNEGHDPVNPLKVLACADEECNTSGEKKKDGSYLHHYSCYMKHDLLAMLECDAIAMLPNWLTSKGANIEKTVAQVCGMQVMFFDTDLRRAF